MRIGILGAGALGTGLGKGLAAKGHDIVIAVARTPEKVSQAAAAIGNNARAGTPEEAMAHGDVIIVAMPWQATLDLLPGFASHLAGKIVWDTSNAVKADFSGLAIGTTTSGGEAIAAILPGARIVKAIASFADGLMKGDVRVAGEKPTIFVCTDDAEAGQVVAGLVADVGYDPLIAGPLRHARFAEPALMLMAMIAYGPNGIGPDIALRMVREGGTKT